MSRIDLMMLLLLLVNTGDKSTIEIVGQSPHNIHAHITHVAAHKQWDVSFLHYFR